MYASPIVQLGCISNPSLTRHADKGLQRMSVDDLKQISLGRTLREGVSTVVGSLTLSSCCGFGNLYFVSLTIRPCVFWAYVSLSSVRFLWKIPTCFAEQRETMFFCSVLSHREGNNTPLSGRRKGWNAMEAAWGEWWISKWEEPERESHVHTCTPGSFAPLCVVARGREGKEGKRPFAYLTYCPPLTMAVLFGTGIQWSTYRGSFGVSIIDLSTVYSSDLG